MTSQKQDLHTATASGGDVAVCASALTKRYGRVAAVDDVSFEVRKGEAVALWGPNGAGKTTILRCLLGLARFEGELYVDGLDPRTSGRDVRGKIGFVPQDLPVTAGSVYELGTFIARLKGLNAEAAQERMELLGIGDQSDKEVAALSGGMKQRLALARTLVHQPELLFLDEPTAALDPEASRQVTDLIARLSRESGRTVFLCTHNLSEAQRLCDRVAVINQGKLLAVGAPAQLARDLFDGVRVDIELSTPPVEAIRAGVQTLPGVLGVTLDDRWLAIQVQTQDDIPAVVAKIVELGGAIMRVSPHEHSLEEIYFRVQEEAKS